MTERLGRADLAALAGYLTLACLFFWPVLFTNAILIGYDTVTIFYPHRAAAARAILEGRLPLWNPDHFLGAPLLANPQVAVFYPLNWPLLALPPGPSLAYTMALHFVLAGVFMYAFCRLAIGLGRGAAWLAGVAFAFGGFMAQQTGHLNQVSVAAWLPLTLLLGKRVWQKPSWRGVALLGLTTGLQLLAGHSQESYMILALLAAYVLFLAIERDGVRRVAASWRGLGAVALAVGLGAALAAIQLLPTLELSRLSIRSGGLSFRQASSFSLHPQDLALALLPNYQAAPPNETAAYIGVTGLLLAVMGARFFPRRTTVLFFVVTAVVALLLALGRYTPVYWAAYYGVPGVGLFRVPARWLLLYSFAAATLAGMGLDAVLGRRSPQSRQLVRFLLAVGAAAVALVAVAAVFARVPSAGTMAAWALLLVVVIALVAVVRAGIQPAEDSPRAIPHRRKPVVAALLVFVLAVELYAAGHHLEYNRYTAPESLSALRPAIAYLKTQATENQPHVFRVLSVSDATWDPGDLADLHSTLWGLDSKRVADYVDTVKNKELLTANLPALYGLQTADGYDGGVLPLRRYVDMEGLFLASEDLSSDGRLRDHLASIPEARLLGLLNVAYAITDKTHDAWIDDVYYDLAFATPVTRMLALTVSHPFVATTVGLISRLEEGVAQPAAGTAIARLTLVGADERGVSVDIRVGEHTGVAEAPLPLRTVSRVGAGRYAHATLPLPSAVVPQTVAIEYLGEGSLIVLGLSLIDDRTGASLSIVVCPDFELVHDGDVKIYYNRRVLPRAYVVHAARVVMPDGEAIAAMRGPGFDPAREAILTRPWPAQPTLSTQAEQVKLIEYAPEKVVVETSLSSPGILVLADAFYPGWKARVDTAPVAIEQVNHLVRGVRLGTGEHRVEFSYRPRSVVVGGIISLIAVAFVVVAMVRR